MLENVMKACVWIGSRMEWVRRNEVGVDLA